MLFRSCASPNQVLTWDGAGWVCSSAGGTLLDVLTAGADAHLFPASGNATVSIGDASHAANLSLEGGQISTKWIHATADGVNNIAGSLNVTSNLSALSGISFNPDPNAYRIDVSAANALGFRSPQYFLWAAGVDPTFGNAMMSLLKDGAINKLNVN